MSLIVFEFCSCQRGKTSEAAIKPSEATKAKTLVYVMNIL